MLPDPAVPVPRGPKQKAPRAAPAVAIRVMAAGDLEPARWLVFRAYAQVLIELYGPEAGRQYEVRSTRFMELYLRRDPAGSFVAETPAGDLVGSVFCFCWGEVGWFGSLAVAPERQGQGVGQALTARAVAYLAARGCRRIGLETWPQSPLVRHLYGKFGFVPARSTIKLSRAAAPRELPAGWTCRWFGAGDAALPAAVARAHAVAARLPRLPGESPPDYRTELRVPVEAGWAELAVVDGPSGEPAGFVLCSTRRPSGDAVTALDARLLCAAPAAPEPANGPGAGAGPVSAAVHALLAVCDRRAVETGLDTVTCDVNLRNLRAAALLRERGFRPIYELLRMERPLAGFDHAARSPAFECARWAG